MYVINMGQLTHVVWGSLILQDVQCRAQSFFFPWTLQDFLEHVREYFYLSKMVFWRMLWSCICAWSRFHDLTFCGNRFNYLWPKTFWGARKYDKYNHWSNIICLGLSCMTYNCALDITDNGWLKIDKDR